MKKAFITEEGKTAVTAYYERILESLSVSYEQLLLPTQYGDTFALISGKAHGQTVILLHGSSMNSAMWIDDIQTLSHYYRVRILLLNSISSLISHFSKADFLG